MVRLSTLCKGSVKHQVVILLDNSTLALCLPLVLLLSQCCTVYNIKNNNLVVNYTIIFALFTWWCHFFKFTQNYLSVNEKFQLGVSFLSCANVSDIEKSLTGSEALWPQSDVLPRVKCRRCQDREMKYLVAYIDTFGFLHYFCVMAVFSAFFAPFGQKLRLIFQRSQSIQIPLFKTEMKEAQ